MGSDAKSRSPFDGLLANGILNRSTAVFRLKYGFLGVHYPEKSRVVLPGWLR
jgi:hypothetical protein